jgi:septal ring factor EnvC (AmiA/AmiB activator)
VRNLSTPQTQASQAQARGAFIPTEFLDDVDVAECALDDQLEQLHRQYAAASRAASRAKFELELLEARDDIHAHVLSHAKRQRAAAETRCARLMRAIDALEERLERVEND